MFGRIIIISGLSIATAYGVFLFETQQFLNPTETFSALIEKSPIKKDTQKVSGITMFRGNKTRTSYGTGPMPTDPSIIWQYPKSSPLCGYSTVSGITKQWCGNGWTGQPVVWERPDGITEIIFGAYDKKIHFLNAENGEETRPPFETGDIIKGSVTLDPDGYPLLYSGSRDNFYRIIALDRDVPTELWNIEAKVSDGVWNNDWDGNGLIEDDVLYEGSENGIFHIIKLNRGYNESGKVIVDPVQIFNTPTFSKEFISLIGDDDLSIESSPLKVGNVVYIANSGGRILGFDVSKTLEGITPIVFDFWTGDDTDATLIADDDGYIYAASEEERLNARSKEVGQIIKLDPKNKDNPLVWGIHTPKKEGITGGVWATPALHKGYLYVPTNTGDLLTIDTKTGLITSNLPIGYHAWSSPNIIDNTLTVGTCDGEIHAYTLIAPDTPKLLWKLPIKNQGCIESTPAIWKGNFYFGSREGFIFKVGQKQ